MKPTHLIRILHTLDPALYQVGDVRPAVYLGCCGTHTWRAEASDGEWWIVSRNEAEQVSGPIAENAPHA